MHPPRHGRDGPSRLAPRRSSPRRTSRRAGSPAPRTRSAAPRPLPLARHRGQRPRPNPRRLRRSPAGQRCTAASAPRHGTTAGSPASTFLASSAPHPAGQPGGQAAASGRALHAPPPSSASWPAAQRAAPAPKPACRSRPRASSRAKRAGSSWQTSRAEPRFWLALLSSRAELTCYHNEPARAEPSRAEPARYPALRAGQGLGLAVGGWELRGTVGQLCQACWASTARS